jgi:Uma2 family endonuclease
MATGTTPSIRSIAEDNAGTCCLTPPKGSLYARARVPEYWILNLRDRVLEVYREPHPDPASPHGWAYRSRQNLAVGEHVVPSAAPTARIAVANLLP